MNSSLLLACCFRKKGGGVSNLWRPKVPRHSVSNQTWVSNGYYKVMSNIPKMGHLPTPVKHDYILDALGVPTLGSAIFSGRT